MLASEGDGEEITTRELTEIMGKLVSEMRIDVALGESVTSERFAEDILGFEEVDENEDEDEEAETGGMTNIHMNDSAATRSKLGVIREEV